MHSNKSLPKLIQQSSNPDCSICKGWGLVCENHSDNPWESGLATDCQCGWGIGIPCQCTGLK